MNLRWVAVGLFLGLPLGCGSDDGGGGLEGTGGSGAGGSSSGGSSSGGSSSGGSAGQATGGSAGSGTGGSGTGGSGTGGAGTGGAGTGGGTGACASINTGFTPVCDTCMKGACCTEMLACQADTKCTQLVTCLQQKCATAPNLTACALQQCGSFIGGASLATPIQTCQEKNCTTQCAK
ncbi:MAG: hypothetical protein IT377_14470 [Polyangiaceae bacterium]|nr:hypothetical protein [Polyangiaceae bacterium]